MITVDWRDLGIPPNEKPFADGAVGELFHVVNPVASFPGRKLVYKKIKTDLPPGLDRKHVLAQMRSVVGCRDVMSSSELADLDEVTVWPLAMVRQDGADAGILLELIADEFFAATKPSNGPPGRVLFELSFLCVSDGYFSAMGIDPSVAGNNAMRLALAARLAYAVEIVHRRPVVFGDLHLKNAVAAAKPHAQVLLVDCDGIAELSDTGRIQLHGPGFIPPEIHEKKQRLQDQLTDIYKLGLCIIRVLSHGKGATQATDPAKTVSGLLDAEGIELLRRAVNADRSKRPQAVELTEYFVRRVRGFIREPELMSAELSHRVALRGSEIFVRWEQQHGTEVRIFGTNGFSITGIDPNKYASGYPIQPKTAGPIDVEVWNDDGPSTRLRAGILDYYELPSLDIAEQIRGIPRPVIPEVPALGVEAFAALEPYPVAVVPDLSIEVSTPKIEYPALTIGSGHRSPGARVDIGLVSALGTLEKTISKSMKRMTKAMRKSANNDAHAGSHP